MNSRPAVDAARAQYQRLRAGAQAVVALGLGVFAVGMGAEGWHYAREVGASGDDYTGLLAIPAGVLLVAVGVVTLDSPGESVGPGTRAARVR